MTVAQIASSRSPLIEHMWVENTLAASSAIRRPLYSPTAMFHVSLVSPLHAVSLQNMEKDKALERRFQQVYVKQPNVEDTVSASVTMIICR